MKRTALAIFTATASAIANPGDDAVDSRRNALDLAGAWSNDGFKLRDGHWSGSIEPGAAKLIKVSLFAGNQYWFTFAGPVAAKKIAVSVFDESGNPVQHEQFAEGSRAAAGFSPKVSGPYLIKLQSIEAPSGSFTLVYSYK